MALTPESQVIEILRARCSSSSPCVQVGIGDDAAVTTVPAGHELVTATDALVLGTHFLADTAARSVGHRCLAANLSDVAAMGAVPRWATLALSMPAFDEEWVSEFAEGFASMAAEHDVILVGGDTVHGALMASVTVLGSAPAGQAVCRSGARPGDSVFVTGSPGSAAAGCAIRMGSLSCNNAESYLRAFEFPVPRVAAGIALREMATAMIDLSDGLLTDLQRLLGASGVGADCELPDLSDLADSFGVPESRELFFAGGEDYELCFTVPPEADARVYALAQAEGFRATRLGEVTELPSMRWSDAGKSIEPSGDVFEHFQEF